MRLSDEEVRGYFALLEASTLLFGRVSRHLRIAGGVTHAQFEILGRLAEAPDGLRMSDLASICVVSQSGLTYQASQLEKMGLLRRSRNDADERVVMAEITSDGRDLLERLLPAHVQLVRDAFFKELEGEELTALIRILGRVVSALRQSESVTDR